MMRLLAVTCIAMLMMTACSEEGGGGSLADCDDVVDAGIDMLQTVLDELGELELEDLAALGDEEPEALQELEERGEELEAEADALGCTDEELQAGLEDSIDDLEANGEFAELILDGIREEGFDFGDGS